MDQRVGVLPVNLEVRLGTLVREWFRDEPNTIDYSVPGFVLCTDPGLSHTFL